MKIPILKSLETQKQWLSFHALVTPLAYIGSPLSLVDFQTNFLQITDVKRNLRDGRSAKKFSIGDKTSEQAAWDLIASNHWSLKKILAGLNTLDFNSNVRDNSAINAHSNITVREFFSKDRCIISPVLLQPLAPLNTEPKQWFLNDIKCLLANAQFDNLEWLEHNEQRSIKHILLQLISYPEGWKADYEDQKIRLSYRKKSIVKFTPHLLSSVNQKTLIEKN